MENSTLLGAIQSMFDKLNLDIQDIKKRTETIESDVCGIKVILESDIDRKIDLLSEGHDMILSHIPSTEDIVALDDRVSTLETVVKIHSQDINELKKAQ